jgi:hypothetical protein
MKTSPSFIYDISVPFKWKVEDKKKILNSNTKFHEHPLKFPECSADGEEDMVTMRRQFNKFSILKAPMSVQA